MKILILGAEGNLGGQLYEIFSKNSQNEVIGWDKNELDITNREQVSQKISQIRPGIIINAVAYNAVDRCETDEAEFALACKLNAEAPAILAAAALEIDAVLIHYSTDYVFPGDRSDGYRENSPIKAINKYGESKALGEKEIARAALKGLKWYLIRTSKLFGPQGKSQFAKPSFFDIMLKLAQEKNEIEAVDEEKSFFTYTPDLADATAKLLENKASYGVYHLTNSEAATWYEACRTLFDLAEIKTKITPVPAEKFPRPAKRPKYSKLLNTKTAPLRSYRAALEEYLKNK